MNRNGTLPAARNGIDGGSPPERPATAQRTAERVAGCTSCPFVTSSAPQRTELEVAADTVALLLDAKVIPLAPADVRRACDATGVPVRFLQHRWHRIAEGLRPRPTARPVHRSAAEVVPRPVKRYGAGLYARLPTTSLAEVRRLLDEGGHQQKDIAIATGVSSSTVTLVKQGYYNDRLAS